MIESFVTTYSSLFDLNMWSEFFMSQEAWGLIIALIIMEGLLSADNALVLAIMVRTLPEHQQKKALFYGLLGAYLFRFIAIGLGLFLVKFWYIKLLGALYLYFLAIKFFIKFAKKKENIHDNMQDVDNTIFGKFRLKLIALIGPFWATVASIELMDVAFSVDSVLAAIAMVNESTSAVFQIPALLLGGMLGILMMRGVARIFLRLLKKFSELEVTAHVLIFLIATKMAVSLFGIHVSHGLFFTVIILVFASTFVVHYYRKRKNKA